MRCLYFGLLQDWKEVWILLADIVQEFQSHSSQAFWIIGTQSSIAVFQSVPAVLYLLGFLLQRKSFAVTLWQCPYRFKILPTVVLMTCRKLGSFHRQIILFVYILQEKNTLLKNRFAVLRPQPNIYMESFYEQGYLSGARACSFHGF